MCVRKGDSYEFADLKGIRPNCTDSVVASGESIVLHGDFDGYVYHAAALIDDAMTSCEKGFDSSNSFGRQRCREFATFLVSLKAASKHNRS